MSTQKLENKDNKYFIKWDRVKDYIKKVDIIINCTTLGWDKDIDKSPLSNSILNTVKKNVVVYDIIYQPKKTQLLKISEKLGFKILNGETMNLYQAIFAFQNTVKDLNPLVNNKKIELAMIESL